MSEMSSDSKGGSQTGQPRGHWCRKDRFLTLMLLLGLGLATGAVLLLAGDLRVHRPACRVSPVKANLRLLHIAVNQFHMDNGRWPTQAEGLTALVRRPADAVNWRPGGYLDTPKVPKDPWGHDYIYEPGTSPGRPFVIKTLGADGVPGGDGYDTDLSSATPEDSPVLQDSPTEQRGEPHGWEGAKVGLFARQSSGDIYEQAVVKTVADG